MFARSCSCFHWPGAGIVASQARRAVLLRKGHVLEGCVLLGRHVQAFVPLPMRQNCSKPFWRRSPVLVLDACRQRVKVGFRDRRSSLEDSEFVASSLCVTGAALSSVWLQFRGRRIAWELFVPKKWQAQYFFGLGRRFRGKRKK